MIQIQIRKNRYFETAFFVLRPELSEERGRGKDRDNEMTKEANRILAECNLLSSGHKKKKAGSGRFLSFLYGLLVGASVVALLWLAVLLLA
ncbi:MAG: hypothetical protein E7668_05205 [Ruminococcaceae bacterium]|nr:hypothetical protein [Oscillospiraceae bacterium]